MDILQLDAQIFGQRFAPGEDRKVLEHRLAAITESRGLHRHRLQGPAQLVHHQRCQRFSFDILGDDQQRAAHLRNLLQKRQQVLHRADLLFMNQDQGILQHTLHTIRIRYEVRRQVAAIELHPFNDVEGRFDGLRFLHSNDAILADFLHGFGDDVSDRGVIVGGNGSDLRNHVALHRLRQFLNPLHCNFDRALDSAFDGHRVSAGRNGLHAFAEDGLGENGRGCRPIAGNVAGLGSDFLHHLRAHVLERIFQFDFFGYGDAVFGDRRRSEFLVDDDIAALRAKRNLDCISQQIHATQNGLPGIFAVDNLFCH